MKKEKESRKGSLVSLTVRAKEMNGRKGQSMNQSVYCHYCGKQGHSKKEGFKFQRDQNQGKGGKNSSSVRQVEEIPEDRTLAILHQPALVI